MVRIHKASVRHQLTQAGEGAEVSGSAEASEGAEASGGADADGAPSAGGENAGAEVESSADASASAAGVLVDMNMKEEAAPEAGAAVNEELPAADASAGNSL